MKVRLAIVVLGIALGFTAKWIVAALEVKPQETPAVEGEEI